MLFILDLLFVFFSLLFTHSLFYPEQLLDIWIQVYEPTSTILNARFVFFLFIILIFLSAERIQFRFGYPVASQDVIDASERLILDLIIVFVVLFNEISPLKLLQNSIQHLDLFEKDVEHRVLVERSIQTAPLYHSDRLLVP